MRTSGILMHISSLPSPYGIGTLGQAAYDFADFLKAAGQHYWQLLPIGPTSYGDSPYQSFSTHAGNPYFIDLDLLREDGLLTQEEIDAVDWEAHSARVDYGFQYSVRFDLLYRAFLRGWERDTDAVREFRNANPWVEDYALYMALKRSQDMRSWETWPEEIRLRRPGAAETYAVRLGDDVHFFIYLQYLFFGQWDALRSYVHALGLEIIGDLPIYVPYDSCDVWANPSLFQLDETGLPTGVAGCPPDYFSADGQLWGNPLYDWERMRQTDYAWWKERIAAAARLFDVIRIDHFRGLESYWAIPYGDKTARGGKWVKGPGHDFVRAMQERFPDLRLIAEDLGFLTDDVIRLQKDSGWPGMKVLEFAFDSREPSNYLQLHLLQRHARQRNAGPVAGADVGDRARLCRGVPRPDGAGGLRVGHPAQWPCQRGRHVHRPAAGLSRPRRGGPHEHARHAQRPQLELAAAARPAHSGAGPPPAPHEHDVRAPVRQIYRK